MTPAADLPPIDMMMQPGPCQVCGCRNYPLSYGGTGICPACDCGPSSFAHVIKQQKEQLEVALAARAERDAEIARLNRISVAAAGDIRQRDERIESVHGMLEHELAENA